MPDMEGKFDAMFKELHDALQKQAETAAQAAAVAAAAAAAHAAQAAADDVTAVVPSAEGEAAAVAAFLGPDAPSAVEARSVFDGPQGAPEQRSVAVLSQIFEPPIFRSALLESAEATKRAKKAAKKAAREASRTPPSRKK